MPEFRLLPTLPSLLSSPAKPFIHRDISWLQFNERVLAEARESGGNPLLERVKFLAISASNLDEFFMVRLASLNRTIRSQMRKSYGVAPQAARLELIRESILEAVAKFGAKQMEVFDILANELEAHKIHLVRSSQESETTFALGKTIFEERIFPRLSPPETFQSAGLSQLPNLKIAVLFPDGLWFKIPRSLTQVYRVDGGDKTYYFFLDDLLETYLGKTFGLRGQPGIVRVTRDADFNVEIEQDDPASVPDIVRTGLGSRENGWPVRLQYRGNFAPGVLDHIGTSLRLLHAQILPAAGTMFLHGLWTVVRETPEASAISDGLKHPLPAAHMPRPFQNHENIFEKLRQQDYLLHHPYDSFDAFVSWVRAAAEDPKVTKIEQTIYRMDASCPLIDALTEAAKHKRVRVIIELRARFDEYNNLRLADTLRKAGVEIAYGFGKLKLHAKVTLVTRTEEDGDRIYTHLSTGNYNATTARAYTDLAILTSHPEIGADARLFFDSAWEGKVPVAFKRLVSAPIKLHRRLLSLIHGETQAAHKGLKTHIVAKVNALVDEEVIEALYSASQAGVQVDLIVRGACSLIPGVTGLSDNIRVISVVDRFLEHSRLYYFESAKAMYLSSADWMPRNFFSRLEIAFPVLDPRIYSYIEKVLIPTYLSDNSKARELTQQGTWKKTYDPIRFTESAIAICI